MSEREKTNKQNQVDQLNRGLLNMLDGTANPAGRTQTNGSVDKESDMIALWKLEKPIVWKAPAGAFRYLYV